MKPKQGKDLARRIDLGVRLAVAGALAEHKQAGRSIAVWEDGRIVIIPPEEIEVPHVDIPPDLKKYVS